MKKKINKNAKNLDSKSTPALRVNRKQKRKEERKNKKKLKNLHYMKKNSDLHFSSEEQETIPKLEKKSEEIKPSNFQGKKQVKHSESDKEKKRKKMLIEANKVEEMNLKKLEKQLHLNKRKGKSNSEKDVKKLPKSFMEDGLGYILEACDGKALPEIDFDENSSDSEMDDNMQEFQENSDDQLSVDNDNDDGDEEKETVEGIEASEQDDAELIETESKRDEIISSDEDESEMDDISGNMSDDEQNFDDKFNENGDETQSTTDAVKEKTDKIWEDIYGRQRDSEGNVLVAKKYVPPALRNLQDKSDLTRLEKQVKGQLNRLAESNLQSISRIIEDLYIRNSRNDMNQCMLKVLKSAIIIPNAITPERLVMEHAVFIALLHANVGNEVGATITQDWIESMMKIHENSLNHKETQSKELDNYVMFTAYLYTYQVITCDLIFDLMKKFVNEFNIKNIELIILTLRLVGFNLRKDDPSELKSIIVVIQKKSSEEEENNIFVSSSRVKFMLETLMAIKNNNVKKIPNYDPSHQIHLTKVMKNYIRPGADLIPLKVRLEDLLQAETRGKWWIVGSAWSGRENREELPNERKLQAKHSQELLDLASKMRMNTDSRKTIFCTLMSSNDYLDAFEKLVKISLKSPVKEREMAFVLSMCCLKEPQFNPFYAHVSAKLIRQDRKFRMAFQCAIWDRISGVVEGKFEKYQCTNLARFTSHLIKDKALPMSCLKKVEFADMNKNLALFMKSLIKDLLNEPNEKERYLPFSLVSADAKLTMLKESLRLFMHRFIIKSKKETDSMIKSRAEEAEQALMATK